MMLYLNIKLLVATKRDSRAGQRSLHLWLVQPVVNVLTVEKDGIAPQVRTCPPGTLQRFSAIKLQR